MKLRYRRNIDPIALDNAIDSAEQTRVFLEKAIQAIQKYRDGTLDERTFLEQYNKLHRRAASEFNDISTCVMESNPKWR